MSSDRQGLTRWLVMGLVFSSLLGIYTRLFPAAFLIQGATFALGFLWIARGPTSNQGAPFRMTALAWGGFLAMSLLSSLTSQEMGTSLAETLRWAGYAVFFFLGANLFRNQVWSDRAAQFLLLLGLLMAGVAIYFYWGELGAVDQPVMNGSFGNKNHLAGFFGLLLPLGLALYLAASTRRQALAYGATSVVFLACLFLTYSRGGWFALAPGLMFVLWGLRGMPRPALLLRLGLLALAAGATTALISGANLSYAVGRGSEAVVSVAQASVGGEPEGTLAPRLDYWQGALRIMVDYPLLGTGPGTFQTVFPEYQRDPRYYSKFTHNFPLQAGAEMGLPGLLLALALLGGVGWQVAGALKVAAPQRVLALGLAGGVMAAILHNLVELDWYIPALANLFWLEVGLLAALVAPEPTPSSGRRWSMALAAMLLILSGLQLAQQGLLWRGDQARNEADFAAAEQALTWAGRLNPLDGESPFQQGDLYLAHFEALGQPADLEKGIAAAQEAVARGPRNSAYRALLARLYLVGDSPQRPLLALAVEQLEAITTNRPAYSAPHAYQQLSQAYLRLERPELAEATYQSLLAGFPDGVSSPQPQFGAVPKEELAQMLAEAHLALGNIAFSRNDQEAAALEYEQSIALVPQNPPAQANLGLVYYRLGRLEQALPHLELARALAPNFATNYYYLGLTYLGLGRRQEATEALRQAVTRDPANAQAQQLLQSLQTP